MATSREDQGWTVMTRERWQQVCDLLENALELALPQRPSLLDRACSADRCGPEVGFGEINTHVSKEQAWSQSCRG